MRNQADGRERALIAGVAALLSADREPSEMFAALCELLATLMDTTVAFIALRSGSSLVMEYIHDHGEGRPNAGLVVPQEARSWHTLRTGEVQRFGSLSDIALHHKFRINPDQPAKDDTVSAIFVPLQAGGERIGVLSVQSAHEHAYGESDVALLEAIGRYLAIALRNQRLFARLQRVAEIDPLTGLANHSSVLRAIDERLSSLTGTLGIVMIDITNFGRINDIYGAGAGDSVLDTLAEVLSSFADSRTMIGRFGGDDFVVVAERAERSEIAALVDEIGARTSYLGFRGADDVIPISVNRGWVTAPQEGMKRAELVALADVRLRFSVEQGGAAVGAEQQDLVHFGSFGALQSLVDTALVRDPYTRMHLLHVNHVANTWGPRLGLNADDHERFVQAALLHDLGKLLIPESILLKPARLDADEYRAMQRHAEYGCTILSAYEGFEDVARIVGEHHERWDGRGYPNGIADLAIDRLARAVSVIDAYSAMTLDRPYHRGISEDDALLELERCAGTQFDPEMVASFVAMRRELDD